MGNQLRASHDRHKSLTSSIIPPPTAIPNTKTKRQSNIELLRIIAMFLVLVVHADFWSLGGPNAEEFLYTPANAIFRTLVESISIVCVNVFVMISGWFGIKPNLRGFISFIFQCAFFLIGIYAFLLCTGLADLSIDGILGCLCLTSRNWFIKAYIALYILSPLLNAFLEKASKRQVEVILIGFYTFQTIYGWYNGAARFIEFGYSCFSFIGLYVLARYLKNYGERIMKLATILWIPMIITNSLIFYLSTRTTHYTPEIFNYVNPFVVIESVGLFAIFANWRITSNKIINFIARSCFAVFLLHTNPNVGEPIFKQIIQLTYIKYDGLLCICYILAILISFYILAIIIDQLRIKVGEYLLGRIPQIRFTDLA